MRKLWVAAATVLLGLALAPAASVAKGVGFAPPQYVDTEQAGGEPILLTDPSHHTIVYSAHEGTTHLYREGFFSPLGDVHFLGNYRNQVLLWTSKDGGASWQRVDFGGGFRTDPTKNSGFSDPDLTMDEGGRMYGTGINLVNDSLFASDDGGMRWDKGTAQCHDGDRPWLAGGKAGEVYMATDPAEDQLNHRVFMSEDGGQTCSATGVPDFGTYKPTGESYNGFGKLLYQPGTGRLAEPEVYMDDNGNVDGVGAGTWSPGDPAFTPHKIASTRMTAHWPAMAMDRAGTLYVVWDTDERQAGTSGGCNDAATPAPNTIRLSYSKDFGQTWSAPAAVAHPGNARAVWPWVMAGDPGKVSVVWYQTASGELPDLDCQTAHLFVYDANLQKADTGHPSGSPVNASGRPIHDNSVCQGGTTCVATGQDRRLGDFFSNALDERGCVIIGTADTMLRDPITGGVLPTSRPLFIRQNAGPALIGRNTCG
jgi:hypothetical protein